MIKSDLRILVTGCNGQVGIELKKLLPKAFPKAEFLFTTKQTLDLANLEQVKSVSSHFSPYIIINAAAYTAVDKAEDEPNLAYLINSEAPSILAEAVKKNKGLIIHFSTDYVFDGKKQHPYCEEDLTNPLNSYGKSKLGGEQGIQKIGGNYVVLRTSWVYSYQGKNFLKTIINLSETKKELSIINDQRGVPTSATWIAEIAIQISKAFVTNSNFQSGIYHCTPAGETTWFEYAKFILTQLKKSDVILKPILTKEFPTKARRPLNSRLLTKKIHEQFGIDTPNWQDLVNKCLDILR